MSCKTCDELISAYEVAVRLYTNAAKNLAGMLGDDVKHGVAAADSLHRACHKIHAEMIAHWEHGHPERGPSPKVSPIK